MKILRHFVPNLFTCLNLFCGLWGILLSFNQGLTEAFFCVIAAAIFDFLDGFSARLLNARSEFGKQMDSLADAVTFGVLPGIMLFHYISITQGNYFVPLYERSFSDLLVASVGLLVPVFSALRLAKFNVDEGQNDHFLGLPTPANAIMISSLGFVMELQFNLNFYNPIPDAQLPYIVQMFHWDRFDFYVALGFFETWFHVLLALATSFLLVARIPMFSLKLKSFGWKANKLQYTYLVVMAALVLLNFLPYFVPVYRITGIWPAVDYLFIPLGIVIYIFVSIFGYRTFKNNEL